MICIYIISQYIDKDKKKGEAKKKQRYGKRNLKNEYCPFISWILSGTYTKINKHGAN